MSTRYKLLRKADNLVKARFVDPETVDTDAVVYYNEAAVTASLLNSKGDVVAGPIDLEHVPGDEGRYRGAFEYDQSSPDIGFQPENGNDYVLQIIFTTEEGDGADRVFLRPACVTDG